jgi:hypothetical protein
MNFDNKDINWFVEKITDENQSRDFLIFWMNCLSQGSQVSQLNVKRQENDLLEERGS